MPSKRGSPKTQVLMGDAESALALADATLGRAETADGVAMVAPLLERVRGDALLRRGDAAGARRALEASLAAGRTRRDLYETALTLQALIRLDRREGVEPLARVPERERRAAGAPEGQAPAGTRRCRSSPEKRSGPEGPLPN